METKKGFAPSGSWIILLGSWLVFAFNAISSEIYGRVSPLIITELNIQPLQLGAYDAVLRLAGAVVGMYVATWGDKQGRAYNRKKYSLLVGALTLGFCFILGIPGVATTALSFYVIRWVMGVWRNQDETQQVNIVGEWWPLEKRGIALGMRHTSYPWGTLIGGFMVSGILAATNNNWRLAYIIVPIISIPFWIFFWVINTKKRFEKNAKDIVDMGMTPVVTPEDVVAIGTPKEIRERAKSAEPSKQDTEKVKGGFKGLFANPNVIICASCSFFGIVALFGLGFWLSPYLAFVAKYNPSEVARYSVMFTITGGLGQILWGWLSDKVGRKLILTVGFAWLAVGFYLLQFASRGLGTLIAIQLFIGLFMQALFPVSYSMMAESADKTSQSRALSMNFAFAGLSGFFALMQGLIIQWGGGWESINGYMSLLYVFVGMMVVATLLVFFFSHETIGPRRGRDFALVSYESCNVEPADKSKK